MTESGLQHLRRARLIGLDVYQAIMLGSPLTPESVRDRCAATKVDVNDTTQLLKIAGAIINDLSFICAHCGEGVVALHELTCVACGLRAMIPMLVAEKMALCTGIEALLNHMSLVPANELLRVFNPPPLVEPLDEDAPH